MPKPRGGQRPNYNSGTSGGGGRFAALNDYQNGGKDDEMNKKKLDFFVYCEIEGQNLLNKHIFLSIFWWRLKTMTIAVITMDAKREIPPDV